MSSMPEAKVLARRGDELVPVLMARFLSLFVEAEAVVGGGVGVDGVVFVDVCGHGDGGAARDYGAVGEGDWGQGDAVHGYCG